MNLDQTFKMMAGVVGITVAALVLCVWQLERSGTRADKLTERRYQSYLLADELRQSSDDLTRLARTFVVSGDAKWEQQYLEVLDIRNGKKPRPLGYEGIYWDFRAADTNPKTATADTGTLAERMKVAGISEAEFAKLSDAKANSDDLVRTETVAMNMVKGLYDDGKGAFTKKGEPDRAKAAAMMHDLAYHQYKARIMKPVDEFLVLLEQRTRDEVAAAQAVRARWAVATQIMLFVTCIVGLGSVWMSWRKVREGLGTVRAAVTAIAEGNLAHEVAAPSGRDLLAVTLQGVQAMHGSLHRIISQVRAAAVSIATGSSEIASGSMDLSQRTERQAASLQHTTSSMDQINATVKANADTALEATRLASSASAAAAQGGSVVSQVVATMDEITASSRKITDIIGVIDGIAFQTNILALNAAVEAARAGEQGRGFAVVAAEVRTLAQRSAEAAKEIKTLIGASVERVETGTRLVADAGASMQDLVGQVKRIANLNAEISAVTAEQTNGIGQVSAAVTQLDEVTQQNAALVEQSAAAAAGLKQQASSLAQMVSVFKLEEAATA
jgi:methyl-accepting chemotaxis protein